MQHSIEILHKSPNVEKIFGDEVPDRPRSGKKGHFVGLRDDLLESELNDVVARGRVYRFSSYCLHDKQSWRANSLCDGMGRAGGSQPWREVHSHCLLALISCTVPFEASSQQTIFHPTVQSSKQVRLRYIFRTPVGQ
jgi:hypothetical protein